MSERTTGYDVIVVGARLRRVAARDGADLAGRLTPPSGIFPARRQRTTDTIRSAPDSAPHTSPGRPSSWRTSAFARSRMRVKR